MFSFSVGINTSGSAQNFVHSFLVVLERINPVLDASLWALKDSSERTEHPLAPGADHADDHHREQEEEEADCGGEQTTPAPLSFARLQSPRQ